MRAGVVRDANVWLQNMSAAADRVRAIPYVDRVWIHRGLPAHVQIVVTERTPYAALEIGRERVLVDKALRVLSAARRSVRPVIVIGRKVVPAPGTFLRDSDALRLVHDYQMLLSAHVIVQKLAYDKFGDLIAVMRGGVRLLLGDDTGLSAKSGLIEPILSQVAQGGRRIAAIDLRAQGTPVVVYR